MMVSYPRVNSTYKHYKGGRYQILTMAEHTTTKEKLVITKSLEFGSVYARPLSEFFDLVKDDEGNSQVRFILLND